VRSDVNDFDIIARQQVLDIVGCCRLGIKLIAPLASALVRNVTQRKHSISGSAIRGEMPFRNTAATNQTDTGTIAFWIARSIRQRRRGNSRKLHSPWPRILIVGRVRHQRIAVAIPTAIGNDVVSASRPKATLLGYFSGTLLPVSDSGRILSKLMAKDNGQKKGKRVLLVDDDAEIVESLRLALESNGYNVLVARDGNQGLALSERENPDLVILDMMMPKRSGFLVLEKLRRTREVPVRVIMITANEGSRHKAYAEMLGVDDYIRKPFAMDKLVEAVSRLLA
jgi:CheY-like chemotaxis protein